MKTQMEIVRSIIATAGFDGIRTEQVKIEAMRGGCSCSDRFIRWLAEGINPEVVGMKKPKDKTKTWWLKKYAPQELRGEGLF